MTFSEADMLRFSEQIARLYEPSDVEHLENIFIKLGVENRQTLILRALEKTHSTAQTVINVPRASKFALKA